MSTDLLTIVTPTVGDSCGHLNRQMVDLKEFTRLPFLQVVSDDGSAEPGVQERQRQVCATHGAVWTENPGPTYGVSYNLNHAFSLIETPWAFCVEDGLRPGLGWLETAVSAVERIGNRRWGGHLVGMMGTCSFDDWQLAMAGALPTALPWQAFVGRTDAETYSSFWGGQQWPNWNDGLWCWARLLPALKRACEAPGAESWPHPFPGHFRDVVKGVPLPYPYDEAVRQNGYRPKDSWPAQRTARCGWFPGAFMLVNMEAWRGVGKFRDGCTFFEGHLGVRMAQHGYLSLCLDFPPWMHYRGHGFVTAAWAGKRPRHHEPCDGPNGILLRDFGRNGDGHVELYDLVYDIFPKEKQRALDGQLAKTELWMDPRWEEWK